MYQLAEDSHFFPWEALYCYKYPWKEEIKTDKGKKLATHIQIVREIRCKDLFDHLFKIGAPIDRETSPLGSARSVLKIRKPKMPNVKEERNQ